MLRKYVFLSKFIILWQFSRVKIIIMTKIKAVILDFDGVILESFGIKTNAFYHIYSKYGVNIAEKVVQHHIANGGISRYEKFKKYHNDYLGIILTPEAVIQLDREFSLLVTNEVLQSPFVPGSFEFITQNWEKYTLFISSGTPEYELKDICNRRNLSKFFVGMFGSPLNKVAHIQSIMQNYQLKPYEIVFVGDAINDKIAAQTTGLHFIARLSGDKMLENEIYKMNDLTNLEQVISML